jgi:hypothetical protein
VALPVNLGANSDITTMPCLTVLFIPLLTCYSGITGCLLILAADQ